MISWDSILPQHSILPDTFKQALPHLLASLCYHEPWLRSTLPSHHPLFSSYLFASGAMAALKPHIVTGCNRCIATGMEATGIPPHLVMASELTAVVSHTQQLKEAVLSRCDELPAEMTDVLLSKFSINGALPVTMDNMRQMLHEIIAEVRTEILDAAGTQAIPSLLSPSGDDPRFQLWMWGGKLRMVPEKWTFPSTNVKDTWNLWHFGHLTDRIRPLRFLKKFDLGSSRQVTLWSKTRGVMQAISQMMVDMGLVATREDVLTLSAAESSSFFDRVIVVLMEQLKAGSTLERRRWMELAIPTVYALVLKERGQRKRKRRELEEEEQEVVAGREGEEGECAAAAALLSELAGQREG
jgi:hypothetical protein